MNSYEVNWGSVLLKTSGRLHENVSELDTCYVVNIELNVNKTENMENITKIKNNLFSAFLGFLFIIPTYINNSWL